MPVDSIQISGLIPPDTLFCFSGAMLEEALACWQRAALAAYPQREHEIAWTAAALRDFLLSPEAIRGKLMTGESARRIAQLRHYDTGQLDLF